jgi:orotidine-5'-phosphate decarboxylase
VAVKPQLACFERLGAPGWAALVETIDAARAAGLLAIADGKRGDVPVSAAAYGQALVGQTPSPFGPIRGLDADAFTANPLLGADALEPLFAAAEDAGAGVFALVRTSNPGAADVQDLPAPDAPLFERFAALASAAADRLAGDCGLTGAGAVVGATEPRHLARMRELMPSSIFLLPGIGAQGGRPEDLGPAYASTPGHPAAALVAASRSIAGAADPAGAAEELRSAVWAASGA